jgi:hypothetical protein
MTTIGGWNMYEAMLFIIQYLYVHFVLFLVMNQQCMVMNHFKKLVLFCHTEKDFFFYDTFRSTLWKC